MLLSIFYRRLQEIGNYFTEEPFIGIRPSLIAIPTHHPAYVQYLPEAGYKDGISFLGSIKIILTAIAAKDYMINCVRIMDA